ncbi:MAG: response regulator [Spirochaetaceae bacterium]|jgi:putative two-component system response regulator|nr:response regulator [Spirochaetaceae bacterium]
MTETSRKKVILAVDDMALSLTTIRTILSPEYDVRLAKSASLALEMLKQIKVDLILLDIEMPEISGLEFLGLLKRNPDLKDIPVIFVTSHANPQFIDQAMAFEAEGYIVKPFVPAALIKRVKSVLNDEESSG